MHAVAANPRNTYARSVRQRLTAQRDGLREAYRKHPNPDRNLSRHAQLVDAVIREIADELKLPATLAVAAVGGYGRGFLFPASDVDLVVVLPEGHGDNEKVALENFVSMLWDVGLEPGIAVRTIAECVEEAGKDLTVDTSLLEARGVWGDAALVDALRLALKKARSLPVFFAAKIDEQRRRYARHNDVALNLEPNIKESPGGLRDLQTIMWLARAADLGSSWKDLEQLELITPYEGRMIRQHRRTLIDLRIRLHYLAGRREDRLVFDHQTALAKELKLAGSHSGKSGRLPSEVLMRRYYLSAKAIWQMSSILLPTLLERISQRKKDVVRKIDDEFELVNGNIAARDEKIFQRDPLSIFRAFLALQSVQEAEFFEPETLRALWRAVYRVDKSFRDNPEANRLFLQILRSPKVTFTLRRMSRYGVLGRYLPAFGRIVGQMQHDLFHVYTVDEHILMVIRNMRRLVLPRFAHEFPFCHELAYGFDKPELLYLAALFHDIAKGRGGDHSALGGKDARRFGKKIGLPPADTKLVEWLVETHLVMSATAQKQDLSDPEVIAEFAAGVGNERNLIALYLLTVADVRGTSPHVWNAWKSKLLEQLFRSTQRLLRGDAVTNEHWVEYKRGEALTLLYGERAEGAAAPADPPLWEHVDASYFQRFEAAEIAIHARMVGRVTEPPQAIVDIRATDDSLIAVSVMARDQPRLFARITGLFERLNLDIAAARIYTTRHGYALDTFLILPKSHSIDIARDEARWTAQLAKKLGEAISRDDGLPAAAGRLARQVRHFPLPPSIKLNPSRRAPYYELSIACADRPGLLSSVARMFVKYNISLFDARINTLGQRAEDVFVIEGAELKRAEKRDAIVAELTKILSV